VVLTVRVDLHGCADGEVGPARSEPHRWLPWFEFMAGYRSRSGEPQAEVTSRLRSSSVSYMTSSLLRDMRATTEAADQQPGRVEKIARV
jgi:hypothetical protein